MPLFLFNTLHRKKELFVPITPGEVRIYSCGPTVYGPAHIGNLRAYIFTDVLRRTIKQAGLMCIQAMNITDVGHLVGDGDDGEDKLEAGAKKEGSDPLALARKYEDLFWQDYDALHCQRPEKVLRATDAIEAQISLIRELEAKGFIYRTDQALYFNTSRLSDYGKLTGQNLSDKKVAARSDVVVDAQKKHPADFALWFFLTGRYTDHVLRWESPWGPGFPGWHLECSAISRQLLGQPFDIHTGGVDHVGTHHTNEIAQSEAAYGEPLSHIWMHNEHLLVQGSKMSKSQGNIVTLNDIVQKGFLPLDFRYLCLTVHYRTKMNFTWDALAGARTARKSIEDLLRRTSLGPKAKYDLRAFNEIVSNDLDTAALIAKLHQEKDPGLWRTYDNILGLGLIDISPTTEQDLPIRVKELFVAYQKARATKDYHTSDALRIDLLSEGYKVNDLGESSSLTKV